MLHSLPCLCTSAVPYFPFPCSGQRTQTSEHLKRPPAQLNCLFRRMRAARRHASVTAGLGWRPRADLGSGGSLWEGGVFPNGFASAGRVCLGGEQGAGAGAAPHLCRAEKGEGLGVRTPSSLPAPALWAEPHRWGWAKGRALRRGPSCSTSFAAQPRARGLRGRPVPVWPGGWWARTQGLEKKRRLPGESGTGRPETLSPNAATETAAARGCRPPGSARVSGRRGQQARVQQAFPASAWPGGRSCGRRGLVPEEGRDGNAPENTVAAQTKNTEWLVSVQLLPAFLGRVRV